MGTEIPVVVCWATSTLLKGTDKERKTYFLRIEDGERNIAFSLEYYALDNRIVAVPYQPADYDYTEYDDTPEAYEERLQHAYELGMSEEEAREYAAF